MQSNDLIKRADELKTEANEIIDYSGVIKILEKIGKVNFVGSFALNLLYRPDIDIFVINDKCSKEIALNTTKKLLESDKFQTVGFANCTDYKAPNNLSGYYWELIYIKNNRKWKFDVWYTAENKIITIENTLKIQRKLEANSDARAKILKLKEDLFDGEKYIDGMNGFKIYEKVLGKIQ